MQFQGVTIQALINSVKLEREETGTSYNNAQVSINQQNIQDIQTIYSTGHVYIHSHI